MSGNGTKRFFVEHNGRRYSVDLYRDGTAKWISSSSAKGVSRRIYRAGNTRYGRVTLTVMDLARAQQREELTAGRSSTGPRN